MGTAAHESEGPLKKAGAKSKGKKAGTSAKKSAARKRKIRGPGPLGKSGKTGG
jgi:hypothetical protein